MPSRELNNSVCSISGRAGRASVKGAARLFRRRLLNSLGLGAAWAPGIVHRCTGTSYETLESMYIDKTGRDENPSPTPMDRQPLFGDRASPALFDRCGLRLPRAFLAITIV